MPISVEPVDWQPTLGESAETAVFTPLDGAVRHYLDAGAWVDHLPGWLCGGAGTFEHLMSDIPWRAEQRRMYDAVVDVPRLLAWYPRYRAVPDPTVGAAGALLTAHYGAQGHEPFHSAGLCLYRSGADSVAWHGDRIGRGAHTDTLVAVLSLGSPRRLCLRPRGGGPATAFAMSHGDLVVMGGACQRTWDHCVPKTRAAVVGPRISVQFRPAGVA